jgi:hypothetical protein
MLQETSSDIVLVNWNMVVAVDASAGPVQVTLPQAVANEHKTVAVFKVDPSANLVTVVQREGNILQGPNTIGARGSLEFTTNGVNGVGCVAAVPEVLTGDFTTISTIGLTPLLPAGTIKDPGRTVAHVWVQRDQSEQQAWFDCSATGGSTPTQTQVSNAGQLSFYTNSASFFNRPGRYRVELW